MSSLTSRPLERRIMTTIKVTCKFSDCRAETSVDANDVLLVLHADDADRNYYSFVCGSCMRYNMKHADEQVISLIEAYVKITSVPAPSTGYCTCSKPITERDVQCFAFDIRDDEFTGMCIDTELEK